jgi:hypothetical protein
MSVASATAAIHGRIQATPPQGQQRPGESSPTPQDRAAMADALRRLTQEARSLRSADDAAALPDAPDFAARFQKPLHPALLSESIAEPADDDPFIDAYVRWQLTSLDPALPEMDDREFIELMASAPAMIMSPRAEQATVRVFQRASNADVIAPAELQQLRELAARLDAQTALAIRMNTPAAGFRDWVATKLGESGHRPRLWMLERCAATAVAGYPIGQLKSQITTNFRDSHADRSFTQPQRELVSQQAQRLVGIDRTMVNSIVFTAAGGVKVSFQRVRIDADDMSRWLVRLGVPSGND